MEGFGTEYTCEFYGGNARVTMTQEFGTFQLVSSSTTMGLVNYYTLDQYVANWRSKFSDALVSQWTSQGWGGDAAQIYFSQGSLIAKTTWIVPTLYQALIDTGYLTSSYNLIFDAALAETFEVAQPTVSFECKLFTYKEGVGACFLFFFCVCMCFFLNK